MEKSLTKEQLFWYIKNRRLALSEALENGNLVTSEIQYLRGSLRELRRLEEGLSNYFGV